MAGSALAGAGMLAMGIGGGEGLKGVVETEGKEDAEDALPGSPSPPTIEINVHEEDGKMRRIDSVDDQFTDEELEVGLAICRIGSRQMTGFTEAVAETERSCCAVKLQEAVDVICCTSKIQFGGDGISGISLLNLLPLLLFPLQKSVSTPSPTPPTTTLPRLKKCFFPFVQKSMFLSSPPSIPPPLPDHP